MMNQFFIKNFSILATLAAAVSLSACQSMASTASPNPTLQPQNTPVVALVLGGGGVRGFAHVGVIQALEQHGIKPNLIVGTSSGAMVGAIYASGKSADELTSIAQNVKESDLFDIRPREQGLIEGQKLANFINTHVNQQPLERLAIRFVPVATHKETKQATPLNTGNTGQAVRASASVPNLFTSPRFPSNGGPYYVDGGQSALVPARIARQLGADVVIAVDVMAHQATPSTNTNNTASITRTDTGVQARFGNRNVNLPIDLTRLKGQSLPFGIVLDDEIDQIISQLPREINITLPENFPTSPEEAMGRISAIGANARANPEDIAASDVVIRPNLGKYAVFNMGSKEPIIQEGYAATMAQINDIKLAIDQAK